jgi:uncharacterized protein
MALARDLAAIPILDHHCHPLIRAGQPLGARELQRFFTESADETVRAEHVPQTVFFRWAIRELAGFFDCAPTVEAVLAARAARHPDELASQMLGDARVAAVLVDHGYQAGDCYDQAELRARLPCRVESILRLETLAQDLIARHETFEAWRDAFVAGVEGAPAAGYVALKSIVAYRTGLAVGEPSREEAAAAFRSVRAAAGGAAPRLVTKPLNDHLVRLALAVAARAGLVVQFHAGFGDPDVDLLQANPLLMRPLFERAEYRTIPFVVLHAGYPYVRELAYLAAVYPNAYMDVSLAVPFAAGDVPSVFSQALGLAPTSKVLLASDAFGIPELFWLGARRGRDGLTRALGDLVGLGALDRGEALAAAAQILHGNAARLYGVAV